jgi:hypothetical protein
MARVTQVQRIRVRRDCPTNPVYLAWANPHGGWSYWLFSGRKFTTLDTFDAKYIERWAWDIEQQDTKLDTMSKAAGEKLLVAAVDLDEHDMATLRTLITSVKVQLLVSQSPIKWQTVTIEPGSWSVKDTHGLVDVEITIVLPTYNTTMQ